MRYADYDFYVDKYLQMKKPNIPETEFDHFAMLASGEIRYRTFGRMEELVEIPEVVSCCCCEIAEKLYSVEMAKDENGMILQSYGNDGETGTYRTSDLSPNAVQRSIGKMIQKWLAHTDYMYCGVD